MSCIMVSCSMFHVQFKWNNKINKNLTKMITIVSSDIREHARFFVYFFPHHPSCGYWFRYETILEKKKYWKIENFKLKTGKRIIIVRINLIIFVFHHLSMNTIWCSEFSGVCPRSDFIIRTFRATENYFTAEIWEHLTQNKISLNFTVHQFKFLHYVKLSLLRKIPIIRLSIGHTLASDNYLKHFRFRFDRLAYWIIFIIHNYLPLHFLLCFVLFYFISVSTIFLYPA